MNEQNSKMKDLQWVFDIDLPEFDEKVLEASNARPVLMDLWAEWCGPCLYLDPVLKQVVESYQGKILLAKVEVDEGENMKLAGRHQVRGFPTVILFRHGEEQGRFSGAKLLHFIEDFIEQHGDMK